MRYADLVAAVEQQAGWSDHGHAQRVTIATIELLDHATASGAFGPSPPRAGTAGEAEPYGHLEGCPGGELTTFDLDTFLHRLARRTAGGDLERARDHARTVLTALASCVHAGELDGLACPLPPHWTELLADPLSAAATPLPHSPAALSRATTIAPRDHDRLHQDTDPLAPAGSR